MNNEYKLPLGILKQIVLKFDSALSDINEVLDSNINEDDRNRFQQMKEITQEMLSNVYATVQQEIDEEAFKNEYVPMDEMEDLFGEQIEI